MKQKFTYNINATVLENGDLFYYIAAYGAGPEGVTVTTAELEFDAPPEDDTRWAIAEKLLARKQELGLEAKRRIEAVLGTGSGENDNGRG